MLSILLCAPTIIFCQDKDSTAFSIHQLSGISIERQSQQLVKAKANINFSEDIIYSARDLLSYHHLDVYSSSFNKPYKEKKEEIWITLDYHYIHLFWDGEKEKKYKGKILIPDLDLSKFKSIEIDKYGITIDSEEVDNNYLYIEDMQLGDLKKIYSVLKELKDKFKYKLYPEKEFP